MSRRIDENEPPYHKKRWSDLSPYEKGYPQQPLDYELKQGQPIPPVCKTTWLDRLWNWLRRP